MPFKGKVCIVFGCSSKRGKHRVTFASIPKIVTDQGEEHEELTRERRRLWISAISRGDTNTKNILDSKRVCGLHFVSGKAAPVWDRHNIDWVPTLNLGKKEYKKTDENKQIEAANSKARADSVQERRKRIIEQQETEVAKKRKELDQSGTVVHSIDFYGKSTECTFGANIGERSCSTAYVDETEVHEAVTFDRSTQTYLPPVPEGYSNAEA